MFSMIFRSFKKIIEMMYVFITNPDPGPKRILVELNVAGLLDITTLSSTGLYSF